MEEVEGLTSVDKVFDVADRVAYALATVPMICLFAETWSDMKAGVDNVVTRALISISALGLLYCVVTALGSLPADKEDTFMWGNLGTPATCNLQAFGFLVGGMGIFCFDVYLSIIYVLMSCYGWSNSRLKQIERVVVPLIWIISVGFGSTGWLTNSFGSDTHYCWLITEANDSAYILSLIYFVAFSIPNLVSPVCALMIFRAIRALERKSHRYVFSRSGSTIQSERSTTSTVRSSSERSLNATIRSLNASLKMGGRKAPADDRYFERSRQVAIQGLWWTSTLIPFLPNNLMAVLWVTFGWYNNILGFVSHTLGSTCGLAYLIVFLRNRKECRTWLGRWAKQCLSQCSCFSSTKPRQPRATETNDAISAQVESGREDEDAPTQIPFDEENCLESATVTAEPSKH